MKNKIVVFVLSLLIILSNLLVSCGTKTTPTAALTTTATSKPTTVPITTQTTKSTSIPTTAIEQPQYGGTFNYRYSTGPVHFDPYYGTYTGMTLEKLWYQTMGIYDLRVDRNTWDFKISYCPFEYFRGLLAESWETPDMSTYVFHIRQGVHWQDIPPVNGRELTAYDLEYTWHRQTGLGSGFSKPNPYVGANYALLKSVKATDKYTLVFKTTEPSLDQLRMLVDPHPYGTIVAREALEKWGDLEDWRHQIGTGPFILEDYVSGSSMTAVKNTNYWGYDDLYPKNKLPYIDTVKILIIPDISTALAALRSGKIEMVEGLNWEQGASLKKTNPELQQVTQPSNGWGITMMVDKQPFNDIRIRKAMQMSLDLKTIAQTYYGGVVEGKPYGLLGPSLKGYYTPFDEWPQEVKAGYAYNTEGAKKLLTEAGYPSGFKCSLTASSNDDLAMYQILKSYLAQVGINMDIQVMDPVAFAAFTNASKHEMMTFYNNARGMPPMNALNGIYSVSAYKRGHIKDTVFDALYDKAKASLDEQEFKKLVIQADMQAISQQWQVVVLPTVGFITFQPWFKDYRGETMGWLMGEMSSRCWIDQDLKMSMGR